MFSAIAITALDGSPSSINVGPEVEEGVEAEVGSPGRGADASPVNGGGTWDDLSGVMRELTGSPPTWTREGGYSIPA